MTIPRDRLFVNFRAFPDAIFSSSFFDDLPCNNFARARCGENCICAGHGKSKRAAIGPDAEAAGMET